MSEHEIEYRHVGTPFGPMLLAGRGATLRHAQFPRNGRPQPPRAGWRRNDLAFADAARQLGEFLAGTRTDFEVDLEPAGDPFRMAVWDELGRIPYGETLSYGEVATRIGEPLSASRAVGVACGANPLPVFIPCHRVVGADGSLTGFGGGLDLKRFLLDLEFRVRPPRDTLFAFA